MAYQIGFGGVIYAIMPTLFYSIGGTVLLVWGSSDQTNSWAIWVGILFYVLLYFLPSLIANDIKYRIKELSNVEPADKNIPVRHPHAFLIGLVNLFMGITVIGWLIVLFWAMTPGTIVIPRQLEKYFD